MAEIFPADVAALTSGGGNAAALAEQIVPLVTSMAYAYTRGHGFDDPDRPNAEIAAVIVTASARFMGNPSQHSGAQATGPFSRDDRSRGFEGWTLAEQFVLNRYRKRAM